MIFVVFILSPPSDPWQKTAILDLGSVGRFPREIPAAATRWQPCTNQSPLGPGGQRLSARVLCRAPSLPPAESAEEAQPEPASLITAGKSALCKGKKEPCRLLMPVSVDFQYGASLPPPRPPAPELQRAIRQTIG